MAAMVASRSFGYVGGCEPIVGWFGEEISGAANPNLIASQVPPGGYLLAQFLGPGWGVPGLSLGFSCGGPSWFPSGDLAIGEVRNNL